MPNGLFDFAHKMEKLVDPLNLLPDIFVKDSAGSDVTLDIAQKHAVWSPFFAEDTTPLEMLAIAVVSRKLLSTPKGTEIFGKIIVKYLDFVEGSLQAMHVASASNWVTGTMSLRFANNVYRRIGLVDHESWADFSSWSAAFMNAVLIKETIAGSLTGLTALTASLGKTFNDGKDGEGAKGAVQGLISAASVAGGA